MNADYLNADHLNAEDQQRLKQAKSAARLIGLVIPLGLTALSVVLYAIWMPRLPDPMAIHWGPSGHADGFDSPWVGFVMFPVIMLLVTLMYFVQFIQSAQAFRKPGMALWGPVNRLIPSVVLASVVLIFVMEMGTTIAQLDLAEASETAPINPIMFAGFGAAVLVGVVSYLLQPKLTLDPVVDADVGKPLELADSERAVWLGVAAASRSYGWIVGVTTAVLIGCLVMTLTIRPFEWAPVIIMAVTCVFTLLLMISCSRFNVRIDEHGLRAQAVTRWPVIVVPAAEVERVEVGEVNPFAEFGGWGLRWAGGGQMGIVLRAGEGIRIARKNGKTLVITLDDADGAAAVLATAAKRASDEAS